MKKKYNIKKVLQACPLLLIMIIAATTSAQVGIGTTSPQASSLLDLSSTDKALLLTRVASNASIAAPVNGMIIYDISSNCFKAYQNGAWTGCLLFSGVVSAYTCNTGSAGAMTEGTPVSGVTQTITATVTAVGPYSISATANGVTFAGSGTFTGTGAQNIVLTATGTPITSVGSPFTYTLNTTPNCSFTRAVGDVVSPTGQIWMDRNLGATQVATSSADALSYGHLYQWGRGADGHQIRTSGTTTTLSTTDSPGNANYIINTSGNFDWRSPQNNNLWQGVNGINNPCPAGYRLPTETELNTERAIFSTQNDAGAFASVLKLPRAGSRVNGVIGNTSLGYYWTSTVSGTTSRCLIFDSSQTAMSSNSRVNGFSVRCLKN
ncbi:MAG TPA: hypothetical protein VF677_14885 [Flavobacterium sp.]|jgi:uncharacterized protein (TIGR02145 family)